MQLFFKIACNFASTKCLRIIISALLLEIFLVRETIHRLKKFCLWLFVLVYSLDKVCSSCDYLINSVLQYILSAFFNHVTGGGGQCLQPPPPMVTPPTQPFRPPPRQSSFSLKYKQTLEEKWNLEGRFDILVTALWILCPVSYLQMIQCLFKNAKHCVVSTLYFKNFPVDSISETL
jgi:hypothetical protein